MENKKLIVVLGAAESGVGAAILAKEKGFDVFVSDNGIIKEQYKSMLVDNGIVYEEGHHTEEKILQATEVIKSPGIRSDAPLIVKLMAQGTPVISDLEFAARYTNAKLICITGSNGKTTTTLLTYHILKQAGLNVGLAGNVGKSFALQVAHNNFDYYVLEISNFQLDHMYDFKADIAILLNITPDHLDRYEYKFQNYINSKFRILQNMQSNDTFIYCSDDQVLIDEIGKRSIAADTWAFTVTDDTSKQAYLKDDTIYVNLRDKDSFSFTVGEMQLQGKHNFGNSMAAMLAAKAVDIKNEKIRDSLKSFENVEHRLEKVPFQVNGVEFINDSKATNVNSVWYALDSMKSKNVIWIAGGTDKGNDYSELYELAIQKVKALVCLGIDNEKLKKSFGDKIETIVETRSMKDAVETSYKLASPGDVVLLSPACASFDLFKSYVDRGKQFKEAVRNL
ncbi:MAG: UDP-N-acetylmuramoyl-L-alanine--D-glutamate ligase [Bacteroidales bacterium]|nr:UDP-N-acetylmuramoyl-L-alanine--D-glutamate ligase [Bacteroidales bacterium]